MNLFCPDCKMHTDHMSRTWQTEAGIRGAVSTFCEECGRLEIHVLGKGIEIHLPEEEEDAA